MIIVIYIILIATSLAVTKNKYRIFIRPNTIFSILWCAAGILAICNNLGIVSPTIKIHTYIIASVITFNLVYFIFLKNINKTSMSVNDLTLQVNYKVIIVLSILGLLLISPNTLVAIKTLLLTGFSLSAVRVNYATQTASGKFFYVFFTNNLPIAIFGATSLIAAIDLVNKKQKLLLLAIFNVLIGTITFGGRYLIMNFIIYYIAGYLILKKYNHIKMRKSYILTAVIVLVSITILRGTDGLSVLNMAILYYTGSLSYLQVILTNPELYGLTSLPMYGYLTFGFLFEPFVLGLKLLLGLNIDVPSYYFNIYAQPFVNIGETSIRYYNNNTTMFYTFIRDFGESGVVIGTALMAIAVCLIQNRFEKYGKIRSLYILVLLYSVIFNSTMMYNLTSISSSLVIIILLFVSRERNNKNCKNSSNSKIYQ